MTQTHVVAKALLVNQEGKMLVLRRSATDERRPLEGDIPGGWADPGEDFVTAAVRETDEEAGIKLEAQDLQLVYAHTEMRGESNVCWLFFTAKTDQTEVKLSPEHDQFSWMSLDEAIDSIKYELQNNFLIYVRDNDLL